MPLINPQQLAKTSDILRLLEKETSGPRDDRTAAACLAYRQLQQFRTLLLSVQIAINVTYPNQQPKAFEQLRKQISEMLD